jgi:hypothetical protein
MKKNFNTARLMGTSFLWATLLGAGSVLTACSDDDDDLTTLSSPTGNEAAEATSTSLTFSWSKVSNVIQYGYTLKDADGNTLVTDVTTAHNATFTGLQPGHTYTLEVTAYAAIGSDYTNSEPLVLTGTTLSFMQLTSPVATATPAARSVISWEAVDHATEYTYQYELDGETVTATTTDTSFTLDFLPLDQALTVQVWADNPDDDLYSTSDATTVEVTRTRSVSATAKAEMLDGTTYEQLGQQRTLTYYTDGSYVISAWYGTEGYDLEFIVPDASTGEIIPNAYYEAGYYSVPASADSSVWIYTSGGYGALYGTMDEGGLYLWDANTYTNYYMEWAPQSEWEGTWAGADGDVHTKLQKLDDGSYILYAWRGIEGYDFKFTVDADGNITPSSEYYFDSPTSCYWIPYGPGENDGAWVYTTGGYGQLDNTGVWFWDYDLYAYYWFQFSE